MTRLSVAAAACALLAAAGTAVVAARGLEPTIRSAPASHTTATTDDLRPLLDASIAAARQAEHVCEDR